MWWSGKDTQFVRERLVGWKGHDKIKTMQTELLTAGGKRIKFWQRQWQGEQCTCVKEDQPQAPHSICYGTGFIGGYKRFGWKEWLIYRKSPLKYGFIGDTNYDIIPATAGSQHIITTSWISASNLEPSLIQVDSKRRNMVVEFTVNDTTWVSSITFPVTQFKIRVIGQEYDMEVVRVRGMEGVDELLLSESPPRRLQDLLKWGTEKSVVDIRCWTLATPMLYTGDIIEWLEGGYVSQRYTVVENKVSQFRTSATQSEPLTQMLGLRYVPMQQQLGRIW